MNKCIINNRLSSKYRDELPMIKSACLIGGIDLKDQSPLIKSSKKSSFLSPIIKLNSKDPTVKRLRFDYRIFFKSKFSPKTRLKLEKSSFLSNRKPIHLKNPKLPVRFYPVHQIEEEFKLKKKSPEPKLDSAQDLLLLQQINLTNSNKQLELDSFYHNKLLGSQKPSTPETLIDNFISNHREKHVTFA